MPTTQQLSLWEGARMTFKEAVDLSIDSLNAYGQLYDDWCVAYSGGKDSSATVSFVMWAIETGRVAKPKTLSVMYADTRQELPPLQSTAMQVLEMLKAKGCYVEVVMPPVDERFYVYMLGRGVPPPTNRFRWCTSQLKVEPIEKAMELRRQQVGKKFLQITGVRQGESAVRDARIALSCSKDSGECGQGWFQSRPSEHVADTLAPIVHWRLCYVWDWLYFANNDRYMQAMFGENSKGHGFDCLSNIAVVYGDDEARTGCIGCNLTDNDTALENIISTPDWAHLAPLREIKVLLRELRRPQHRLRKNEPQKLRDGSWGKNVQRLGPLHMDARAMALAKMKDIQDQTGVVLINREEEARIRELWNLNTWPDGWDGTEIHGDVPIDRIQNVSGEILTTHLLI